MMRLLIACVLVVPAMLAVLGDMPAGFENVANPLTSPRLKTALEEAVKKVNQYERMFHRKATAVKEGFIKSTDARVDYRLHGVVMMQTACPKADDGTTVDVNNCTVIESESTLLCDFKIYEEVALHDFTVEESGCIVDN